MSRTGRARVAALLAAPVLVGLVAGGAIGAAQPVSYRATSTVFVSRTSAATTADVGEVPPLQRQIEQSFAEVVDTPIVLDPVVRGLRLQGGVDDLAARITVDRPAGTALLRIGVDDRSGRRAAATANAVARSLVSASTRLQPQAPGAARVTLTQVQQATVPAPSSSELVRLLLLGGGAGLLVTVLVLAWRHRPRRPPRLPVPALEG